MLMTVLVSTIFKSILATYLSMLKLMMLVKDGSLSKLSICQNELPYILAYKSKNFGQIFALKVRGSTYMRVRKEIFFWLLDNL